MSRYLWGSLVLGAQGAGQCGARVARTIAAVDEKGLKAMLKSKILAMGLAVSVALTSLAPSALSGVSGAAMSGAVQRSAHPYPYPHPGHGPYHHHHKKKRNNAGTAAAVGLGFLTLGILAAGAAERDRYTQRDGYYYPEYPQSYPYPSQQPYPYPEPQQPYLYQ